MAKKKHRIRFYFESVVVWIGLHAVNSTCSPFLFQPPEPSSLEKYKVIK